MALIHQLVVDADEKELARERIQSMLNVYQRKSFTKDNLSKLYAEWEGIAKRLRHGENLIAEKYKTGGDLARNAHFISLSNLYQLLASMCGIYDVFFQAVFPPEEGTDRYQRAHDQIMGILLS